MAELIALPPQVAELEAGGYIAQPEGTIEITENGIYNVKAYANADVNVHPDLGTLDITENGTYSASTYDKDGFEEVTVDVQPTLITKTIISNGTYKAEDDNADGYDKVEVAVPRTVPIAESSLTPAAVGMDGNGVYISDDTSDETLISMGRDLTGIFAEDVA